MIYERFQLSYYNCAFASSHFLSTLTNPPKTTNVEGFKWICRRRHFKALHMSRDCCPISKKGSSKNFHSSNLVWAKKVEDLRYQSCVSSCETLKFWKVLGWNISLTNSSLKGFKSVNCECKSTQRCSRCVAEGIR